MLIFVMLRILVYIVVSLVLVVVCGVIVVICFGGVGSCWWLSLLLVLSGRLLMCMKKVGSMKFGSVVESLVCN